MTNTTLFRGLLASALLTLSAGAVTAQDAALQFTATNTTVSQDFNSMGTSLELPTGWRIDRHLVAPRAVNPWSDHLTAVMYTDSENLLSNQANGTYNWRATADQSDVALGGLSTTSGTTTVNDNKTRGVSVSTAIKNAGTAPISKLTISYDVEKYRYGNNASGFQVQMFSSTDGVNWTEAGSDFNTKFDKDDQTIGASPVPIATVSVANKQLLLNLAAGETIYLAWNVAVASGTTTSGAQGLSVDNIKIEATYDDPSVRKATLCVEDATGWETLMASTATGSAFDAGQESAGSKSVNGVTYKVFEFTTLPAQVKVNNGVYYSLGAVSLTEPKEYYYTATTKGMVPVANPETHTGYRDPSIPAFQSSGIYIRGDVNSWGATAAWEFSKESETSYALYNVTLSGAFKVADAGWSSACNYGSNGSNAYPGEEYALVSGSNDNISCGSNAYAAKEIRLNIVDGAATLKILTDDDATGITKVYMVGDFNNWDYMNTDGCLTYSDGLFRGTVKMPRDDNDGASHWMIYQKLGMGGAWGVTSVQGADNYKLNGTLTAGRTTPAAAPAGTYAVTFDINTGAYTLTRQASEVVDLVISPAQAYLVPELPAQVKVLSMNNSLIEYNDQPGMFNELVKAMGKDAEWVRHTNLGKTLDYHWDEGDGYAADGRPGAKMLVRTQPWSHIILQEQTARPVTNTGAFYASVRKWVEYIRDNCPNPNVVIILPLNWEYSSNLDTYAQANQNFAKVYTEIADELGIVVCPVGLGYVEAYNELGGQAMKKMMYSVNNDGTDDDRHPTPVSTYMAAVMEYALIYGVDPSTVTWAPTKAVWRDPAEGQSRDVNAEDCAKARVWASNAMKSYKNRINHTAGTVTLSVEMLYDDDLTEAPKGAVTYAVTDGPGSIDANGVYTAAGEGVATVKATADGFSSTLAIHVGNPDMEYTPLPAIELGGDVLSFSETFDAIGADEVATLPEAWRIDRITSAPRTVGVYSQAGTETMYAGGANLANNAKNGIYNFGADEATDRALGGITTGVDNGTRALNLYTHIQNTGKDRLTELTLSYDVEKYRMGANKAGFTVSLWYSMTGNSFTRLPDFDVTFEADSETKGYESVPGETRTMSGVLPFNLEPGVDLYLAWNISAASGTDCSGAQALAVDNIEFTATKPSMPVAQHYIYADDQTGWNALGLYAYGDSEFFGTWPGTPSATEMLLNGKTLKVFAFDTNAITSLNLIFNNMNAGSQAPDFKITEARDYYLTVTAEGVTENPLPEAKHYIYVDDRTGWPQLGLYAWGDSEFYGKWPGISPMSLAHINDTVYKVFPLDSDTDASLNLIFNNWNNGSQASDFNIKEARDYYLTVTASGATEHSSGIDDIVVDSEMTDAPVEWFDMMGRRIDEPAHGFAIRRQGTVATKVIR